MYYCVCVYKVDGSFHVLVAAAAEPASFHLPSRHPLGCHIIDPSFLPSPQGFTNSTFPSHSTRCSIYIKHTHSVHGKAFYKNALGCLPMPLIPRRKKKTQRIPHSHMEDDSNFVAFPRSRCYWMDGWMDGLRVTSSLLSIQPFPQNIVYH
jgi:hypothetical protein